MVFASFFQPYAAHRDLPSFPTRRSSDLKIGDGIAELHGLEKVMAGELLDFPHDVRGLALNLEEDRSEEHTSELQSPCNLVCRLLLEKKKKSSNYAEPRHLRRPPCGSWHI